MYIGCLKWISGYITWARRTKRRLSRHTKHPSSDYTHQSIYRSSNTSLHSIMDTFCDIAPTIPTIPSPNPFNSFPVNTEQAGPGDGSNGPQGLCIIAWIRPCFQDMLVRDPPRPTHVYDWRHVIPVREDMPSYNLHIHTSFAARNFHVNNSHSSGFVVEDLVGGGYWFLSDLNQRSRRMDWHWAAYNRETWLITFVGMATPTQVAETYF